MAKLVVAVSSCSARGRQLGGRLADSRDDHRHHQGALARGARAQDRFQAEALEGTQRGHDVSVGKGAADLEPTGPDRLASESATKGLAQIGGPVCEVTQGLVLDLAARAGGPAEPMGRRDPALIDSSRRGDMDGA
jgi:hypothetical protein